MATYHVHSNTISRGRKTTATSYYKYITRQGKWAKRDDLIAVVSGNLPSWAETAEDYWCAADAYERKNGRLCKTYDIALPKEMGEETALKIGVYILDILASPEGPDGMELLPYTGAFHRGANGNIHVHGEVSERITDDLQRTPQQHFGRAAPKPKLGQAPKVGGARKSMLIRDKAWLQYVRQMVADVINYSYEQAGLDYRVDHRSYKARGIDKKPGEHIGPRMMAIASKLGIDADGIATNKIIRNNIRDAINNRNQLSSTHDAMSKDEMYIDNDIYDNNIPSDTTNQHDNTDDDRPTIRR